MKFCRYGPRGSEKPGLIDGDGRIRDLSAVVDDLTAEEPGGADHEDRRRSVVHEISLTVSS